MEIIICTFCFIAGGGLGAYLAEKVNEAKDKAKDVCTGCIHLKMLDDNGKHCRRYMAPGGTVFYCADRKTKEDIKNLDLD